MINVIGNLSLQECRLFNLHNILLSFTWDNPATVIGNIIAQSRKVRAGITPQPMNICK